MHILTLSSCAATLRRADRSAIMIKIMHNPLQSYPLIRRLHWLFSLKTKPVKNSLVHYITNLHRKIKMIPKLTLSNLFLTELWNTETFMHETDILNKNFDDL